MKIVNQNNVNHFPVQKKNILCLKNSNKISFQLNLLKSRKFTISNQYGSKINKLKRFIII